MFVPNTSDAGQVVGQAAGVVEFQLRVFFEITGATCTHIMHTKNNDDSDYYFPRATDTYTVGAFRDDGDRGRENRMTYVFINLTAELLCGSPGAVNGERLVADRPASRPTRIDGKRNRID